MQRAGELDWLRALAALTVIAIHITGSYVDFLSSAYYANHLARFAVPLFIIISGFVLHYSNRRKEMTVLSFTSGVWIVSCGLIWSGPFLCLFFLPDGTGISMGKRS